MTNTPIPHSSESSPLEYAVSISSSRGHSNGEVSLGLPANSAAEALELLTWDTPSSSITPAMSPELDRLMTRMFMEF